VHGNIQDARVDFAVSVVWAESAIRKSESLNFKTLLHIATHGYIQDAAVDLATSFAWSVPAIRPSKLDFLNFTFSCSRQEVYCWLLSVILRQSLLNAAISAILFLHLQQVFSVVRVSLSYSCWKWVKQSNCGHLLSVRKLRL
jgi:hypothetical protein